MKTIAVAFLFLLSFTAGLGQNARNVLIEYATATNCGYCPCMDSIIEQVILQEHPNTVAVAYHNNNMIDPFGHFYGSGIIEALSIIANPTALANRGAAGKLDFDHLKGVVDSIYQASPTSPLAIKLEVKNWNAARRMFEMSLSLTPQQDLQGTIASNMVVIENNLIFYQSGHTDRCFGGEHYQHDLVARALTGGVTGNTIATPDTVWSAGARATQTEFWCLDISMVPENCQAIYFVFDRKEPLETSEVLQAMKFNFTQNTGLTDPKEIENEGILNVYPNPSASSKVNIHFRVRSKAFAGIEITAADGKKTTLMPSAMVNEGVYNLEIEPGALPEGLYLITLTIDDRLYTSKLISTK